MIDIIDTGGFAELKAQLSKLTLPSHDDIQLILGSPHHIRLKDSLYSLNYTSSAYQSLLASQHPLLSAVGQQKGSLLDACGGFGKDSFLLSHNKFSVTTCENNPIIALLLSQAVNQYCQKVPLNWETYTGNAQEIMQSKSFDIVYLDPMFQIQRSAKPKLSMQIIQALTAKESFTDWKLAFHCAKKRLVIKQHQKSIIRPELPNPSLQIKGKQNIRYDIYLK